MPRIQPIEIEQAPEKSRPQLEAIQKKLGKVPNLMKTMARSPAVLGSYTGLTQALGGASLGGKLREQLAVAIAGASACDYCASAHTAIGQKLGASAEELADNLRGRSSDSAAQAAIEFALAVVEKEGFVSDDDLRQVREAGYDDAAVLEIVAVVALNLFTNYLNHVAETEIDFPVVRTGEAVAA